MGRLWVWKSKENHLKIDTACQKGRWISLRKAKVIGKTKEATEQKADMQPVYFLFLVRPDMLYMVPQHLFCQ